MNVDSPVFLFDQGIPGFENLRQFIFLEIEGNIPMRLMKSLEDQHISLLVVSPFFIYPEYEWELSEPVKQELLIKTEADVEVWSIVTLPAEPSQATLNLLAPLVLNRNEKVGKQLILHDSTYSSRAPLIRA
ncbi:flagellar assembly protein FliW [Paenibacillus prosopidis]|uniref:Flagellar assembly factor FliW n=1 Tax=Paenibacillus prosopidis TaxID=630520 RepID=A0A368VSA6_9BACL|nr:flagellar assembly protein FliW [Paenibacillus prosopidis]RCW44815.1 flagellar assembly factor FliW [Paenibacillus prosopidis]